MSSQRSESVGELIQALTDALRGRPEPKCKNCRDTGYYFDNNGHGQLTWKRKCPCRRHR